MPTKKKRSSKKAAKKISKKHHYTRELENICKDYALEEDSVNFLEIDHKAQSMYFGKWVIKDLLLKHHSLDDDYDIHKTWFDEAYDENVDWITKYDDSLIIVQSKYGKSKPNDIKATKTCLDFVANPDKFKHPKLKKYCRKLNWEKIKKVYIYYVTNLVVTTHQKTNNLGAVESIPQKCKVGGGCNVRFNIFDVPELERRLISEGAASRISDESVQLTISGGQENYFSVKRRIVSLKKSFETHIFTTTGHSLCDAANKLGLNSLFHLNYRYGLGGSINEDIIGTAEKEPDKFFAFNNGISCLAKKSVKSNDKLSVSQLQVINGAQTLTNLFDLQDKHTKKIELQIRVTDFGDLKNLPKKIKEYLQEIVRCNNTQNKIEESDFLANETFHNSISKFLNSKQCNYHLGGAGGAIKKVRYHAKRKDYPTGVLNVKFPDFLKKTFACLHSPAALHVLKQAELFSSKADSDSPALQLFGNTRGDAFLKSLKIGKVRQLAAAYWIAHYVDRNIKPFREDFDGGGKEDREKFVSIERGYHTYWAMNHIIEQLLGDKYQSEMQGAFSRPGWVYDDSCRQFLVLGDVLDKAVDSVAASMIEWTHDKKMKMAQWKKSDDVLGAIKSKAKSRIRSLKKEKQIEAWLSEVGVKK